MSTSNFNLRGISPDLMCWLKQDAKILKLSVNALILKLIEGGLGVSRAVNRPIYHDLDHLAGTWSSAEVNEFNANINYFEQIDADEEFWK